ncbi:MAG: alpha/beta hydrolase [Woeseiaceae bacterium]|nr:alpha/beta hydrolase [Woeseiaceae bacterium]
MKTLLAATAIAVILTSNSAEAAMKKRVTFESAGQTLVGDLYLPDSYSEGDRLPGVVVTGAWMTVKEQMAGTYAAELADRGYAALAFDFRGWGQSPDEVRFLEDPARKTEDINAAVNFLAKRPEVDSARIAGLGVCASAGYMSDAALQNANIKSLTLVAPWLHDADIVDAVYGGEEGVSGLIGIGREAAQSNEPVFLEAASLTNENAVMYQAPYYTETDRGLIPEFDNRFNVASWEGWLTYDAIQTADRLEKPTLLVHSEAAAIPQGAREYANRMGENATAIWLPEVTQFDFYDRPDVVKTAADAVARHLEETLK